jgi:hypothetical protein
MNLTMTTSPRELPPASLGPSSWGRWRLPRVPAESAKWEDPKRLEKATAWHREREQQLLKEKKIHLLQTGFHDDRKVKNGQMSNSLLSYFRHCAKVSKG